MQLTEVYFNIMKHDNSEIPIWSYFHLGPHHGVVVSHPVIPVDTISEGGVIAMVVQAIQVGIMTVVVPPGSMKLTGAVSFPQVVIILILSAEWLTVMISEGITSSS